MGSNKKKSTKLDGFPGTTSAHDLVGNPIPVFVGFLKVAHLSTSQQSLPQKPCSACPVRTRMCHTVKPGKQINKKVYLSRYFLVFPYFPLQ